MHLNRPSLSGVGQANRSNPSSVGGHSVITVTMNYFPVSRITFRARLRGIDANDPRRGRRCAHSWRNNNVRRYRVVCRSLARAHPAAATAHRRPVYGIRPVPPPPNRTPVGEKRFSIFSLKKTKIRFFFFSNVSFRTIVVAFRSGSNVIFFLC